MKVDVTVIVEFPEGMPRDVITKLARVTQHPAALEKTTVTDERVTAPKGSLPRRHVIWKTDGIDIKDATPDDVFQARVRAAAKYGIKLTRTIRRIDRDGATVLDPKATVFWTWGEVDLMELAPLPIV
jgi:hypothetical protein